MKLQFAVVLKDRHGREVVETSPEGPRKVTLGDVCCAVLDAPQQGDSGKDKARAWELMGRITAAEKDFKPLDLLDTDLDMIKDRLGKMNYTATLYGATLAALKPIDEVATEQ